LEKNDYEIAEILIRNGADINFRMQKSQTLLHHSSLLGRTNSVQFLLSNNSKVNSQDDNLNTPLHNAVTQGHTQIVRILIENGADTNIANIKSNLSQIVRHHSISLS